MKCFTGIPIMKKEDVLFYMSASSFWLLPVLKDVHVRS